MQWHGRLNFVPLRIRMHRQNDVIQAGHRLPCQALGNGRRAEY
ncbi:BQ5605_C024g09880 [Microbotryum silenes-dioicae]|uniref:BQ5605_C024g09880 protein n=1 Tax=Microbotryum silenes-dioicae TaxID=796604 RepID=A0A2X0PM65_9BASI|nr:BQ5605_C024g09880 [Microbotryum silenes-dioicae]